MKGEIRIKAEPKSPPDLRKLARALLLLAECQVNQAEVDADTDQEKAS